MYSLIQLNNVHDKWLNSPFLSQNTIFQNYIVCKIFQVFFSFPKYSWIIHTKQIWVLVNLFFLPCQRVQPGPSTVSDNPVSAENIIYEAFFLGGGEIRRWFFALLTDPVQPGLFYKQLCDSINHGLWKYIQNTVNPKQKELGS